MQHTEMLSLDDFDHWVPKFCIFVVSENPLAYSHFGICWFLNSLHFVKSPKFDPCGSYLVRPQPTCTRVWPESKVGMGRGWDLTLCESTWGKSDNHDHDSQSQHVGLLLKMECTNSKHLQPISDSTKVDKKNRKTRISLSSVGWWSTWFHGKYSKYGGMSHQCEPWNLVDQYIQSEPHASLVWFRVTPRDSHFFGGGSAAVQKLQVMITIPRSSATTRTSAAQGTIPR